MYDIKTFWPGGEGSTIFFLDTDKPTIIDVGQLFSAEEAIEMTKDALHGRKLEYILLSHSHYDHIGALSEFRKAFPEAVTFGSEVTAYVFSRPGAIKVMKELSEQAVKLYLGEDGLSKAPQFDPSGFTVDNIVKDGDCIDLGNTKLEVFEAPGHTNCSVVFYDADNKVMFTAESTGAHPTPEYTHVPYLKSFKDCIESIHKCKAKGAERVFVPHLGEYEWGSASQYFDLGEKSANWSKQLIIDAACEGKTDEEIIQILIDKIYYPLITDKSQPLEAFLANAYPMLNVIKKEFSEYFKV